MEDNVVVGKDHLTIADVNARNKNKEENQANAKLIAAAPELLEACKSLVDDEKCRFDHHGYCQTHFSGSSPCLNQLAKQAIAKAEGAK